MKIKHFNVIIGNVDRHLECDEFRVNLGLKSGRVLNDYAIASLTDLVLSCSRDDHPPIYVEVEEIEMVELSTGLVDAANSPNRRTEA